MAQDTSKKPYVSNYPPLAAWLNKIDARCMHQEKFGRSMIEQYMVRNEQGRAALFIVLVHPDKAGWEIYTPLGNNEIAATLEDAEQRLGLKAKS